MAENDFGGSIEGNGSMGGIGGGNVNGSDGLNAGGGDSTGGTSDLGNSGTFGNPGGTVIDLSASAGPNPGSPTIAQVLSVIQASATVLQATTGMPFSAAAATVAISYGAVTIGGYSLGQLLAA